MSNLMTRDAFREAVLERDGHKCVLCSAPAKDAHHIMERRLFQAEKEFGGYFLENGASVCGPCHIKCEETTISVEDVRYAAGIKKIVVPEHLYADQLYDKWSNSLLANGQRIRGELFWDESVQKILKQGKVLDLFTHWVKYPRTYHLPWSPGISDDDRMHTSTEQWHGKQIVVGVKMDGENTSMYADHIHARSVNSGGHPSRDRIKAMWAQFCGDIPSGWRVCAENVFAKHSIHYTDLTSYLIGFGIWTDKNICLNWDQTLEWFELLGIEPNKTLYEGIYDEQLIKDLANQLDFEKDEGYVMRIRDSFHYSEYQKYVGKFVRPTHVQTTQHWLHGQAVVPNILKEK